MSGSSAAGEDIVQHLSSNSNPSSSKLAKLEARMAGKAVSASSSPPHQPVVASGSVIAFMDQEELPESSSSDDDNGDEFLIQKNILKRPRSPDDDQRLALGNFEGSANEAAKILDVMDPKSSLDNTNRKKQGRGRGRAGTGRGRGSKTVDQTRSTSASSAVTTNGQLDKLTNKEYQSSVQCGNDDRAALQDEPFGVDLFDPVLCCQELKDLKDHDQQMRSKQMKVLSDLLIAVSKAERQEARMRIRQESFRLGNVGVMRAGTIISEIWEDGQAIKDLNSHLKSLLETKEAIERHRKSLKKRQSGSSLHSSFFNYLVLTRIVHKLQIQLPFICYGQDISAYKGDGSDAETSMTEEDIVLQDEICKSRLTSIKREEEQYLRERDRYELEKGRLIREMKRLRDEDGSRFNNFQILHHRYALLNLLGKGGFSEVYKPGNVLFDEVGVAKVTDFGLSKIVEDDVGSQGMELTSQGAGTYWYLPPECFDLSKTPFISSKVDVWSAGVMFYQMLFGRRPFGHDQTQERILREDTIINARRVEFPSKPAVSNEAKDLIRRCLSYNQSERPDVLTIAQDPYLSYAKR
ncbi:hypothetical protein PR202_gb10942 [Eleusine coracana subsp. coracana]|uniref:Protein kinase domain-containing protein n=1 Tax=Eleusine coracana subsp. coracana TaxID=191504 RepID=A0AAV5EL83_ELECO|nr:hypothetical protein PR202_gb10942 [Eleusine coracana subsp. coracana]